MTKDLRNKLESILNEAFNEVQDSSSWTRLGGEPPQMHKTVEAIEAIIIEARIDELKHILPSDGDNGVWTNFDTEINPITIKHRIKQLKSNLGVKEL